VKQSIERILGLPALRQAVRDLGTLHRNTEMRLIRDVRHEARGERLAAEAEQLQSELESIESDIKQLKDLYGEYEEERAVLSEQRDRFVGIQADVQRAEDLEEQIREAERQCEELIKQIKHLLSSGWWEPVSRRAVEIMNELQERIEKARETEHQATALSQSIAHTQSLIDGDVCPVCEQAASPEIKKSAEGRLKEIRQRLSAIQGSCGDMSGERLRFREIHQFTGASRLVAVREKEQALRQLRLATRRHRQSLDDVQERLRGHDSTEVRRVQQKFEQVVGELHSVEGSIRQTERKREEKVSALSRVRQNIA
jgi:DNA repair exonuclease SbcCD ATPase subunit